MCENSYTRENLYELIKELLDITEVPFQIKRQIRDYISEYGFTYKGIARTLCFMIEQKNFQFRDNYQIYGIGIVTTGNGAIYRTAQTYYEKLKIQQEKEEQRQQAIIAAITQQTIKINCGEGDVKKQRQKKQIDISSL